MTHFSTLQSEAGPAIERGRLARRLDDLARSSNDMVFLTDASMRVVEANDRAAALLGYSQEELLQLRIHDLRDPGTLADLDDQIRKQVEAGHSVFETRYRRKDGTTFPVEASVRVVEIDGRRYHQGTVRDITERKRAQEEVAFQSKLLEMLHDAVVGLDADLRIRSWNHAAERLYGWTAEEAVGRDWAEVLGAALPESAGRGQVRLPLVQRRRDGSPIEVEIDAAALRGSDGELTGLLIATRDITEKRRIDAALRESEAKFRAAFHGAGMGILLLEGDGRMVEVNRAFTEMLGYSEEELRQLTVNDLRHPDELASARAALAEMVAGERESISGECRYRRKNGSYAHVIARATAVRDQAGKFQHAIAVIEDITQRKVLEAQLLFADRMSSIGTLAAGVAHEINNPLAYIVANVGFVVSELSSQEPVPDELLSALRETQAGAMRVREIVRGLKAFSRVDESSDETADIPEVLRFSLTLAQNEIRHRAQLVLDLAEVPPVGASAHRLGQVFLNLLINAAHAIPEGHADRNQIRVRSCPGEGGRVVVEIADTGCGIPEENLTRIFEPFFTTKPVGVGTGLGLSICHGIIAGLGGTIGVESQVGKGSTFRVVLPAMSPQHRAAEAAVKTAAQSRRGRILLVDDDAMVGAAVKRTLGRAHEVEVLTDARAALARLQEDQGFDLVICDLLMPEMTGMELYDELSTHIPSMVGRMVFLTGGAFTLQASEFLARVRNPMLDKPFDPGALRSLVNELLAGPAKG